MATQSIWDALSLIKHLLTTGEELLEKIIDVIGLSFYLSDFVLTYR